MLAVGPQVSPVAWNTKAHNLIKIAKQLIVFKYCELQNRKLHDM
jgi:hypothetical protein